MCVCVRASVSVRVNVHVHVRIRRSCAVYVRVLARARASATFPYPSTAPPVPYAAVARNSSPVAAVCVCVCVWACVCARQNLISCHQGGMKNVCVEGGAERETLNACMESARDVYPPEGAGIVQHKEHVCVGGREGRRGVLGGGKLEAERECVGHLAQGVGGLLYRVESGIDAQKRVANVCVCVCVCAQGNLPS